jgi:DNA-binding NtrC family response regulator
MDTLEPYIPDGPLRPDVPREGAPLILLVDDDMELRTVMRDFLSLAGFRVLEARNSYDGLFLAAQHGAAIQLLITETNLLPVGGIKLAENILRLYPQIQVLCVSDCEETRPVRYWMRYLNASFLRKPLTSDELEERVRDLLSWDWEAVAAPGPDLGTPQIQLPGHSSNSGDPMFWLKEF